MVKTESAYSGQGVIMTEGYCMKCRNKVEIKDAEKITMKNGKPATQGTCPKCGTKVFRIGG
jgi:DNA-directed RNA polymerase subunit RPC12/RpoP